MNTLRPPPKSLANPPEPTTNPLDTTPEPMQFDEAINGRVLRKRKEKIPKHLKRKANEKEMDGFNKRVLSIPHAIVEQSMKPTFQQPNKNRRDDYSIGSWPDSEFHDSFAVETVFLSSNEDPTEEYDEDYWKERATEIAMQDERYSTHSFNNTPPPSIDRIYSSLVSILTLIRQNDHLHQSIPHLVHRSILKPPP
uniref:Uncharacterized protein n=1 Tax=Brassica campestris TaxID=3711 RepID=M4F6R7_BRACM